jgi:hypothetical protein
MISRTIGEVVGEIPCISEVAFNRLNASDPFEQKKLMKATWVLVVIPSYIKRTAGPQFPFDVDSKGNLIEVPVNQVQNGKELVFSCSLENIRLSGSYPLKGRENMPIFHEDSLNEVFDQCGASSDKTSVYFMRRYIVEESRALAYVKQKQLVEKYGFGVTPTRIRALFHAIDILEFGTCSDVSKPQATCARGPETVLLGWDSYSVAIGFFTLKSGVEVFNCDAARDSVGVAPGIPLEEVL